MMSMTLHLQSRLSMITRESDRNDPRIPILIQILLIGLVLSIGPDVSAQGVGISFHPLIVTGDAFPGNDAPMSGPGFGLTLELFTTVTDMSLVSVGVMYSSIPYDCDSLEREMAGLGAVNPELSLSTRKMFGIISTGRFRIGRDLDEICPIVTGWGGFGFLSSGSGVLSSGGVIQEVEIEQDAPFALIGGLGIGVDYPLFGDDEYALVGTVGPQFELGIGDAKGFAAIVTGVALTVGIEYRDD